MIKKVMNKNESLIIVPLTKRHRTLVESISSLELVDFADILIINDGLEENFTEILQDLKWLKHITHEQDLGFGGCFISGLKYARDFEYSTMIFLDPANKNCNNDIPRIIENLKYGYDIVSCSRILENYDHGKFSGEHKEMTEKIALYLSEVTGFNLTDPLSGIIGLKTSSLADMEFTEFSHSLLIQLWIQAAYFTLAAIEIPTSSQNTNFSEELDLYEDPAGYFLSAIESEKYLYKKGSLN